MHIPIMTKLFEGRPKAAECTMQSDKSMVHPDVANTDRLSATKSDAPSAAAPMIAAVMFPLGDAMVPSAVVLHLSNVQYSVVRPSSYRRGT
jgi:hypothetical protein